MSEELGRIYGLHKKWLKGNSSDQEELLIEEIAQLKENLFSRASGVFDKNGYSLIGYGPSFRVFGGYRSTVYFKIDATEPSMTIEFIYGSFIDPITYVVEAKNLEKSAEEILKNERMLH